MTVYSDDVLDNTIKTYEAIKDDEPLSKVTLGFLKELEEYRKHATLEELEEIENDFLMV